MVEEYRKFGQWEISGIQKRTTEKTYRMEFRTKDLTTELIAVVRLGRFKIKHEINFRPEENIPLWYIPFLIELLKEVYKDNIDEIPQEVRQEI